MRSSTPRAESARERARPLLGTIVRIRVSDGDDADAAIDAAFVEIADIHRLMSFQAPDSDLSRIGRAEPGARVAVDRRTAVCLALALDWARRSDGAFDPVAATGAAATWRDLTVEGETVVPARALRVDLSGIAKGWAVDRACAVLERQDTSAAVVEAGGDLRVIGLQEEEIALRPSFVAQPALLSIVAGALAASDPVLAKAEVGHAVHRDGRDGSPLPDRFAVVAAPRCADADALTKIVLAMGGEAAPLLAQAEATAWQCDAAQGWSMIGAAA